MMSPLARGLSRSRTSHKRLLDTRTLRRRCYARHLATTADPKWVETTFAPRLFEKLHLSSFTKEELSAAFDTIDEDSNGFIDREVPTTPHTLKRIIKRAEPCASLSGRCSSVAAAFRGGFDESCSRRSPGPAIQPQPQTLGAQVAAGGIPRPKARRLRHLCGAHGAA